MFTNLLEGLKVGGTKGLLWLEEKMSRPKSYNYFGKRPEKTLEFLRSHF
jgi:hypothetical protein